MDEHQHDQDLIARVSPAERAECEVLVEDFVRREFVVVTRADLHRAAARFEDAGRCKPWDV